MRGGLSPSAGTKGRGPPSAGSSHGPLFDDSMRPTWMCVSRREMPLAGVMVLCCREQQGQACWDSTPPQGSLRRVRGRRVHQGAHPEPFLQPNGRINLRPCDRGLQTSEGCASTVPQQPKSPAQLPGRPGNPRGRRTLAPPL